LVLPSGEGVSEGSTVLNVVEAFVLSSLAVFLEGYKGGKFSACNNTNTTCEIIFSIFFFHAYTVHRHDQSQH